jgi:hypothetical protein
MNEMRKLFFCLSLFYLSFSQVEKSSAYLGNSVRIKGLGDELAGVVEDEYTDTYRNPAYLSFAKRIKVFAQNNVYGYPEFRMANSFNNAKAVLGGFVIPIQKLGNFAFVGELKPQVKENTSSDGGRYDYLDYYVTRSACLYSYEDRSIQNFKVLYGTQISPSLRVGVDFVSLKNYDYYETDRKSETIEKYLKDDSLKSSRGGTSFGYENNSPQAKRGSLGVIFSAQKRISVDFTLYYEHLSFTNSSFSMDHAWDVERRNDTLFYRISGGSFEGETSNRKEVWGFDMTLQYHFPDQKATLCALFSGMHQRNEINGWGNYGHFDLSHYDSTEISIWEENTYENDDRHTLFLLGVGLEKDFSASIKSGAALKGYWGRHQLDSFAYRRHIKGTTKGDLLVDFYSFKSETPTKGTNNSYYLRIPGGLELDVHKMVKFRIGGLISLNRVESQTGYSTDITKSYFLGLGCHYEDRIFINIYAEKYLTEIKEWMTEIEYHF